MLLLLSRRWSVLLRLRRSVRRGILLLLLRRAILGASVLGSPVLLRAVLLLLRRRSVGIGVGVIRIRIIGVRIVRSPIISAVRITAVVAAVPWITESKSES